MCPRIPFYAWIRLAFLLYLILPQFQGARVLYQSHVHPFLHQNELAIDDFISSAHDRARAAGITYLKQGIELIKQYVLGLPPKEPTPPSTPSYQSYTQNLMARFNLPSVKPAYPSNPIPGATSTATDFYSLLASAVSAATSAHAPHGSAARDISNSGTLIPPSVHGSDRMSFITAQRERLAILLSALDKEATNLQSEAADSGRTMSLALDGSDEETERSPSAFSGLSSRKSEPDFEKIEAESGAEESSQKQHTPSGSGSWLPWSWGAKAEESGAVGSGTEKDLAQGKSTGVDA